MHIKIQFVVFASVVAIFGTTFAAEMHAQKKAPVILNVRICDVFANPAKYDKRLVRVVVIHKESFEGNTIIDAKCKKQFDYVSATIDCETENDCLKMNKKLRVKKEEDNIIDGNFLSMIAVGTFFIEKYRSPMLVNDVMFHIQAIEHVSGLTSAQKLYLYDLPTKK